MEVAAAPSTAPTALPEVPQKSTTEPDNDPAVKSALAFLNDPRVKNTPLDRRLTFLRTKGMTPDQIRHACAKAGIQVTEEQILKLPTQQQSGTIAPPPPSRNVQNPYRPTQPPLSTQSQMLYPNSPPPQPEPVAEKGYDWRDIVIGAGAAVLGGIGAYKLFQRYSPFEVRRKPDPRTTRGRIQRPNNTARRPFPRSSGSDTDTLARPPPLPPAPTEPPKSQKDDEEIKRLETELAATKEALASERKRAADLAVSSAKARGEKQQLVRANDRLTEQVDELKAKIEELEKELEKKNDDGAPKSPTTAAEKSAPGTPHETSRPGSRPGSRAPSPHSRPGTPTGLTLEPISTPRKPEWETAPPAEAEPATVAVIDPVTATAPSQEEDMDGG